MHDPLNVYRGRYKEFIEGIMEGIIINDIEDYYEDHHIIPRCTFEDKNDPIIDNKENHINLSARNHFIAHRILSEDNHTHRGLSYAYLLMCHGKSTKAAPDEYEIAKKRYSDLMRGKNHPMYGKRHSEETKKRISLAHIGKTHTTITRSKMSSSQKSRIHSPFSEETKKKISESMKGKQNTLGYTHSVETKSKISKSHKGLEYKKRHYRRICQKCQLEFLGSSPNQKFCLNCKEVY